MLSAPCHPCAEIQRLCGGLKAVTKHEIWLQYVPAILSGPCKHKSHIVKVSGATRPPPITEPLKQPQRNANVMSWKNDYISPAKFNLIWDKRVQTAVNAGHLAAAATRTITRRFWPRLSPLQHVTDEEGGRAATHRLIVKNQDDKTRWCKIQMFLSLWCPQTPINDTFIHFIIKELLY